jgi:hypothetical protein
MAKEKKSAKSGGAASSGTGAKPAGKGGAASGAPATTTGGGASGAGGGATTAANGAAATTAAAGAPGGPAPRRVPYVPPQWYLTMERKAFPCVFTGCPGDHASGTPCPVKIAHLRKYSCAYCSTPCLKGAWACARHYW